jgi:hypothetical protein
MIEQRLAMIDHQIIMARMVYSARQAHASFRGPSHAG